MAFRFTGLLTRCPPEGVRHTALKPGHVVRPLEAPQVGSAIRMPQWQPRREMLEPYLEELGIAGADWVFLACEAWSGPIDYVQRYGQIGAERLESVAQYDQKARRLYLDLMERFGLGAEAEDFQPLRRDFWGRLSGA
ncbi:hypothetical protein [Pseudooceanicola sp.]|uniref:hypothetical protein n=1 Tax=Pseudooceanicola sp. TaxID=1914328 RepID=UPI0035C7134E